jgi:hypothetical protein
LVFRKENEGETPGFYQVKYYDVIALCTEAIKEQSLAMDENERRMDRLELMAIEKGLI